MRQHDLDMHYTSYRQSQINPMANHIRWPRFQAARGFWRSAG